MNQADKLEKLSVLAPESRDPSTNAGSGEESEKETQNELKTSGKKACDSPVLVETAALCYLGILLMRLPIGLADIYK